MRLLALLVLFCVATTAFAITPPNDGVTAFTNVHVVPMDSERVLANQTVLVEGDRIIAMGAVGEVEVPEGANVINGSGAYLMPGLAEMHGHIPPPNQSEAYIESVLFMYVANGITTVRGMLGFPGQLELREQANSSAIVAPNLYLAGPSFNGSTVHSPEQAREKVRQQVEEGWDLLKIHPGLTRAEYDAMAETAHELGITFGGHVPAQVGLAHALDMRQETFDHIDGYTIALNGESGNPVDEAALADLVAKTKEAGAWVVPTMVLWETLYGVPSVDELTSFEELQYMPPNMVDFWVNTHEQRTSPRQVPLDIAEQLIDNRMRILEALHDGGVPVLMGTDAPQQFSVPGFSLHREIARMVEAGMSPYEVIETGTTYVGRYFADKDTFGQVAPGQRADLVLVNENPLEDVSHIADRRGVMIRGQWLAEADIQARLAEIAAMYQ